MAKPRICTGREAVRLLERLGYKVIRVKGSHHIMYRAGSRRIPVAVHNKDMKLGTLRNTIAAAGLSVEEFNRLV